jgi:dephospho-CoA kinase
VRDWLQEKCEIVFVENEVDRRILGTLEDMLYEIVFVPLLKKLEDNYVVDGVMPRFVEEGYDQVIYIHVPENERRRRLRTRGVAEERLSEIIVDQYQLFRDPINFGKN